MITGITIQNFKGIGDEIKLELRPITLLFGANSAGKSSILHALHYAREIFERHNLSPDRTLSGGSCVDLGGFSNFIHQHDWENLSIRLGFQVNIRHRMDDLYTPYLEAVNDYLQFERWSTGMLDGFGEFNNADIQVAICWNKLLKKPYISECNVSLDGIEFASFNSDVQGHRVTLLLNQKHPSLYTLSNWKPGPDEDDSENLEDLEEFYSDTSSTCLALTLTSFQEFCQVSDDGRFYLSGMKDALPKLEKSLPFAMLDYNDWPEFEEIYDISSFQSEVKEGITRLIQIPLEEVSKFVSSLRYLGPIRETPPRNYLPPTFPDDSRWASGLAAWDTLQNGSLELIDSVGEWLGDPENLNAGCHVERRSYFEIDLADPTIRKLINRRAFDELDEDESVDLSSKSTLSRIVLVPNGSELELRPHDVGVGISQVLPVIVMALDGNDRLLAIEQPELHIHPRLQAELADLFVESVHKNQHRFIIETHSEHLILRLLRRIRETEKGEAPTDRGLRTNDLAIYYLKQEDGSSSEQRIDVDVNGEFIQPWPDDFFDIDFKERFL